MAIGTSYINSVANAALSTTSLQAYSENSVAAGSTVHFRISAPAFTPNYDFGVVRLGWLTPEGTAPKDLPLAGSALHNLAPAMQAVQPGSYVHVEAALLSNASVVALTLECWVRPFYNGATGHWMGLITQYTFGGSCGFGLFITNQGLLACYFGDGGAFNSSYLKIATSTPLWQGTTPYWSHVVAVFAGGGVSLYVNGNSVGSWTIPLQHVSPGTSPLRLGAYGDDTGTSNFLDGDLACAVIYSRALDQQDIVQRYDYVTQSSPRLPPEQQPPSGNIEGWWTMADEAGSTVTDHSGVGRNGAIVNHGTWMIGGPCFDATIVDRFNQTYDPSIQHDLGTNTWRGHALRLSRTDLFDCGWLTTHAVAIPRDAAPGIYVGRFSWPTGNPTSTYDVPFVVRPAAGKPPAPIAVLVATNTWHAYQGDFGGAVWLSSGLSVPDFYGGHAGGQPAYYVGINLPLPTVNSSYLVSPGYYYGHLLRAERPLHAWLDQNQYDYDAFGDLDLHFGNVILSQYQAVIVVGHSEYWTREMYLALQAYVVGGGQVICASGNTMFWRVSADSQTIQCRKYPATTGGSSPGNVGGQTDSGGECYHEGDMQRGGLMREAGWPKWGPMPAWSILGLDAIGYAGNNFPPVTMLATVASHAFFTSPEATGAAAGASFGGPVAVGHEYDATLFTIGSLGGSPPAPPSTYAPVVLAQGYGNAGHGRFDYQAKWYDASNGQVINEVIDWQLSNGNGGRVFNTGSIATAITLVTDPNVAPAISDPRGGLVGMVLRNALYQMGVKPRLTVCAVDINGELLVGTLNPSNLAASWVNLGTGFQAPIAGITWSPNNLSVAGCTAAGALCYFFFHAANGTVGNPQGSNLWNPPSSPFVGRPAMVAWGRNRLNIYVRDSATNLWEIKWDGSAWYGPTNLGNGVTSDAGAIEAGGILYIAVAASNGHISYKTCTNDQWWPSQQGWQDLGEAPGGPFRTAVAPTLLKWNGNWVSVFAVQSVGPDDNVWWSTWQGTAPPSPPSGWTSVGAVSSAANPQPVAVTTQGPQQLAMVFTAGNQILLNTYSAGAWSGFSTIGSTNGQAVAANFRGSSAIVAAVGEDKQLYYKLWNQASTGLGSGSWSGWTLLLPGDQFQGSPTVFSWITTYLSGS